MEYQVISIKIIYQTLMRYCYTYRVPLYNCSLFNTYSKCIFRMLNRFLSQVYYVVPIWFHHYKVQLVIFMLNTIVLHLGILHLFHRTCHSLICFCLVDFLCIQFYQVQSSDIFLNLTFLRILLLSWNTLFHVWSIPHDRRSTFSWIDRTISSRQWLVIGLITIGSRSGPGLVGGQC